MLDLVRETADVPTVEAVAERANVSRRSVFRHFPDSNDLIVAATAHQQQDVDERFPVRDLSRLTPPERVRAVAQRLGRIHEVVTPVARAAHAIRHRNPVVDKLLKADALTYRERLCKMLDVELAPYTATQRELLVRSMIAASSWSHWHSLRRDQGLSVLQARQVVEHTLNALLSTAALN